MDFEDLLYRPLYAMFGVDATIRGLYFDSFPVRVIDMTSGIEVGDNVGVKTMRPAAIVLVKDLGQNGLGREDLEEVTLEMNDSYWRVKATMPKPGPSGEPRGELYLILEEDAS